MGGGKGPGSSFTFPVREGGLARRCLPDLVPRKGPRVAMNLREAMQPHVTQPRSFLKPSGEALEAMGMETCHMCPAIPDCWWLLILLGGRTSSW